MGRLQEVFEIALGARRMLKRKAMLAGLKAFERSASATCVCCGYEGPFLPFGFLLRPNAQCPSCGVVERHRLFEVARRAGFIQFTDKKVLHFAPEVPITRIITADTPSDYKTADLDPDFGELTLNIEELDLPSDSYDVIVASHILEHVDDKKALAELFRVLRPGGVLIVMVPIVEGWSQSYEDPAKATNERDREIYFGQYDHIRFYGADIRDRIHAAGFVLDEYTAFGPDCVNYALMRGEKIFRCTKPAA